jgi:hypothetical protein
MRCLFAAALLFPHSALCAQQYVDVFPDRTYVCDVSASVGSGRTIYQLNADRSVERTAVPVPEKISFISGPRPRVRHDKIWISDGRKLYSRSLVPGPEEGWVPAKLPEGLEQFSDFEIISDGEAIICGATWDLPDGAQKRPLRLDLHFVFNHKTGAVKKTIEGLELADIFKESDDATYFHIIRLTKNYLCRLGQNVLIVGEHSGRVTVTDAKGGGARAVQVVPAEEMPGDPEEAVNNGRAIAWVAPLAGDGVLVCCRRRPAPQGGSEYVFRTLDARTGKVALEGGDYRGFEARPHDALFELDGELRPVRGVAAGRAAEPKEPVEPE